MKYGLSIPRQIITDGEDWRYILIIRSRRHLRTGSKPKEKIQRLARGNGNDFLTYPKRIFGLPHGTGLSLIVLSMALISHLLLAYETP